MPLSKRSHVPTLRSLLTPLAAAIGLIGTQAVHAEDLMELYNAARAYDATYLSARANAESVEYRAKQADANFLPQVAGSVSGLRNEVIPPASPLNPDPQRVGGNSTIAKLTGKQTVFNAASSAQVKQAYKAADEAHVLLQAAEQDLMVRVAQAYFDVLAAQDALGTAQASKAAITEQLASAKRNFEVGTATITDTREAQARYDLSVANEIVAENDLRTKRIVLDQLVGRTNIAPKPLNAPAALPGVQPADPDQWVTTAQAQSPAIQRAALDLDIAKLRTDEARAGHLPTLDVVAAATSDHETGATATFPGTTKSASLGLQLNVPIFAGFAVQNSIKEKLALEDKAREDLEAAKRDTTQKTRTAFFGVQSTQAQVKALEAAEASTKLALEATQLGYKVGVRVNLDVLNAQSQLYTTQRDLAKARYDLLVRELQLRQAAGTLQPGDLEAVNALLVK